MQKIFIAILGLVMCASCSKTERDEGLVLKGAWEIQQRQHPDGQMFEYSDGDYTWFRLFDDSCFYNCQVITVPNGTMLIPLGMGSYSLVQKGPDEYIYLEENNARPLEVLNDSCIVIQEYGLRYTWKATDKYDDRFDDIVSIVRLIEKDVSNIHTSLAGYVFSDAENLLKRENRTYAYVVFFVVLGILAVCLYAFRQYRYRKHVEKELKQITEERNAIPEPVRMAMNDVKEEFHNTDFYQNMHRRIAAGDRLCQEDWDMIEAQLNRVYPRFTSTLFDLRKMTLVEHQVCLLLKFGATPSEIAVLMCKDTSTISTIRSRLYKKVFGKNGGSKDWDEFIASL